MMGRTLRARVWNGILEPLEGIAACSRPPHAFAITPPPVRRRPRRGHLCVPSRRRRTSDRRLLTMLTRTPVHVGRQPGAARCWDRRLLGRQSRFRRLGRKDSDPRGRVLRISEDVSRPIGRSCGPDYRLDRPDYRPPIPGMSPPGTRPRRRRTGDPRTFPNDTLAADAVYGLTSYTALAWATATCDSSSVGSSGSRSRACSRSGCVRTGRSAMRTRSAGPRQIPTRRADDRVRRGSASAFRRRYVRRPLPGRRTRDEQPKVRDRGQPRAPIPDGGARRGSEG